MNVAINFCGAIRLELGLERQGDGLVVNKVFGKFPGRPAAPHLSLLPEANAYDLHFTARHGRRDVFRRKLEKISYAGLREQYVAWRLFYQDEFVQAILRGRPYDPSRKKNIFFFSNTFLTVLDVNYVGENELLRKDLWVEAKQLLAKWRDSGNRGPLTQRHLAAMIGVSESAISHAKKKDPKSWELLLAEMEALT